MNEAEWLECADPMPMLEFLRGKASARKLRLFACGCCRRVWHRFLDERSRNAVEVAERFCDGAATQRQMKDGSDAARKVETFFGGGFESRAAAWASSVNPMEASFMTVDSVRNLFSSADYVSESAAMANLFREIVGNQVRPNSLNPSWQTPKWASAILQHKPDAQASNTSPLACASGLCGADSCTVI